MYNLEIIILTNLTKDENFTRKVLPFIRADYFEDQDNVFVFLAIKDYIEKYNKTPTQESLHIAALNSNATPSEIKQVDLIMEGYKDDDKVNIEWLIDETEKWCKDRAVYNAIMESIQIIDGKTPDISADALPDLLTKALQVGFDTNVGHDFIEDADKRFDFYNRVENKVPFDLEMFNKITEGGLSNKTLNIALAGTGVGKSLFMCHMAANCLSQGRNVLYITLEMAEERIAERIDANLMNISMEDLHDLPKQMFEDKIQKIIKNTTGQLIVKEYPTASAHSSHFRGLIKELAIKKSFKPDIIFIDYLNICGSSRFKGATNVNSYMYIKSIAEELRGLAVETNLPIMSATQTTRSGFVSTDIGLEDTSESFGLPATADFMFALISNEELDELNQIAVKQLKNRYNDPTVNKRFVIGIDRAKMRLFDVKMSEQNIVDSGQSTSADDTFTSAVFDKTDFGEGWKV